jgi:peptidoglycan/xylan/chitin deacetylase (PgdA/CDA1 family)
MIRCRELNLLLIARLLLIAMLMTTGSASAHAETESTNPAPTGSPKILLYHHVSDSTPASTSVSPATFAAHLELIEREGYEVVPLTQIVDALVAGEPMASRWVAITFDDAYESVASTAAPMLAERSWPFTVFVSTDYVDDGHGLYLGWDDLRALEADGATIGNHTLAHEHMVRRKAGETTRDWQDRLAREVTDAQARLQEELNAPLRLFTYPYGEFDAEVAELMQSLGFIAFGQQSGAVGSTTNHYAIPRFPLAKGFDSVQSLAEKLRTEHLPLLEPEAPATLLAADAGPPVLELRIDDAARVRPGSLNCFVAGQPNAKVTWGEAVIIQAGESLRAGRSKYTCTAPHPDIPRAYYWHSHLYIKPRADGSWYDG